MNLSLSQTCCRSNYCRRLFSPVIFDSFFLLSVAEKLLQRCLCSGSSAFPSSSRRPLSTLNSSGRVIFLDFASGIVVLCVNVYIIVVSLSRVLSSVSASEKHFI